jgi:hypothetical protein
MQTARQNMQGAYSDVSRDSSCMLYGAAVAVSIQNAIDFVGDRMGAELPGN